MGNTQRLATPPRCLLGTALAYCLAVCFTPLTSAQVYKVGGELQVNTLTAGWQGSPKVAADAAGRFVVVWASEDSAGDDQSYTSVQARRFDAAGNPLGTEEQVNTYTANRQWFPDVAAAANGSFVVVWDAWGAPGPDIQHAILGQRFDSGGARVGGEFQVNTFSDRGQETPALASDAFGDTFVTWTSDDAAGNDAFGTSIEAQRFSSLGAPAGNEVQVNASIYGDQLSPAVASTPAGATVVVFESDESLGDDDDGRSIQGQRYDAGGSLDGTEFQVNTTTTGSQSEPAVALAPSGEFIVVWKSQTSAGTDQDGPSIQAQRYSRLGQPVGSEIQVNTTTGGVQDSPEVAADATGNYVVVWESDTSAGDDTDGSVQAQLLDGQTGAPIGGEIQVNSYTSYGQSHPDVATLGQTGDFVVVWMSPGSAGSDNWSTSVHAQRYSGPLVFADGFESADTSAWSAAAPQE